MKSVVLNVRVPVSLKENLESYSLLNNLSISDCVRDIISNHYRVQEKNQNTSLKCLRSESTEYNSNEFIYLITWLFEKRISPYDSNRKEVFIGLKKIVFKIIQNNSLPDELKLEFEKVFADLTRYISEFEFENNYFHFCLSNYALSFNYYILIKFIYKKAFESAI